jgi:MFS superfamily sulfate permease-like transporter
MMSTRYRIRWPIVIGTTVPAPLIVGIVVAVVVRPVALGVAVGVLAAGFFAVSSSRRMRRRWLEIDDDGLRVQRDRYALEASWADATSVSARKVLGILPVEELFLSERTLIARASNDKDVVFPPKLPEYLATRRVQVNLYDKNWRTGPIGDQLRRRRLI